LFRGWALPNSTYAGIAWGPIPVWGWARPEGAIQPQDVCNNNMGYCKIYVDM